MFKIIAFFKIKMFSQLYVRVGIYSHVKQILEFGTICN